MSTRKVKAQKNQRQARSIKKSNKKKAQALIQNLLSIMMTKQISHKHKKDLNLKQEILQTKENLKLL